MNVMKKQDIFKSGTTMSFAEMLLFAKVDNAHKIVDTKEFKEDDEIHFDIKINGIDLSIEELEKYIDFKFKEADTSLKRRRKQLELEEGDFKGEVEKRAKELSEEVIENLCYNMTNSIYELENKLTENNREYKYHWDEEKTLDKK